MEETEKENLFETFKSVFISIIEDKRKNKKNIKLLNEFKAKVIFGLQIERDYYLWVNFCAENGNYDLNRESLEAFDLKVLATPEDLMYFSNRTHSTFHMLTKKNKFGFKKLRFEKSSLGKRNLTLILKLPKLLVLDKIKKPK